MKPNNRTLLKIMYLNPLGLSVYDSFFAKMIKQEKNERTEVHVTSLNSSVGCMDNLEYRTYNTLVVSDIIKATRQASIEGFDAIIIGCFYDPSILDAREISGDMIVVGPCRSSIEIALKLSNKFSIIIGQKKWEHEMYNVVKEYGYAEFLASFRDVEMNVCAFQKDHNVTASKLFEAAEKAVNEDYAESIILGCTCEFGFYKDIQEKLKVPVIDPSLAALKQAEQAAFLKKQYGWKPSRKWSCQAPSEVDIKQFGLFKEEYIYGNRIVIK